MILPTMPALPSSMELRDTRFRAYNVQSDFEESENISDYFSLTAAPNTNVARRSQHTDQANAPMLLSKVGGSFVLAEVTISADFEMDWDQGGLIIFAGCPPGHSISAQTSRQRLPAYGQRNISQGSKWAKVGLEFTGGEFGVSSVVANPDCGTDWSFTPAFPSLTPQQAFSMAMPSVRVKLERVGSDLWVWYKVPENPPMHSSQSPEAMSRNWKKCREIMGFFDGVSAKTGVWVGCYASRPVDLEDAGEEDGLFVEFEDLEIL